MCGYSNPYGKWGSGTRDRDEAGTGGKFLNEDRGHGYSLSFLCQTYNQSLSLSLSLFFPKGKLVQIAGIACPFQQSEPCFVNKEMVVNRKSQKGQNMGWGLCDVGVSNKGQHISGESKRCPMLADLWSE